MRNTTTGVHDVCQLSVQLLLEGYKAPIFIYVSSSLSSKKYLAGDGMDEVFVTGNNRQCVATDTCKNTVYYVANNHDFKSIEEFGEFPLSAFFLRLS